MYLTPEADGGAEMTLGGLDSAKFSNSSMVYGKVTQQNESTFWEMSPSSIAVNDKPISSSVLNGLRIIFDSGTSNLVFPVVIVEVRMP